jgi:hypothetical protein
MSNTADEIEAKPIAVWLQYIWGGGAVNLLVALYDTHGGKGDVQVFCSVLDIKQMVRIFSYFVFEFFIIMTANT